MSRAAQRCDERLERAVLDAVDVELEHVPDEIARAYDARLLEDPDLRVDRLGPAPDRGDETEIKTCRRWVTDNGSNGSRRRGRWWVSRRAHDQLLELGGAYLLVVLDDADDVLAYLLVRADVLDELLAGRWTSNGNGGGPVEESAQVPWPAVIGPEALGEGVVRGD